LKQHANLGGGNATTPENRPVNGSVRRLTGKRIALAK
jgi:hypothetical protein